MIQGFHHFYLMNFIDGITTNKSIKSLSVIFQSYGTECFFGIHSPFFIDFDMSVAVVSLLKDNHTLQALKINVQNVSWNSESLPSTIEVNTPLNAVDIQGNSQLTKIIIQNCKNLLYVGNFSPPCSISDVLSQPSVLQQLDLSLYSVEHAIDLFTMLKCNDTLTVLQAKIENEVILADSTVGVSLKDMLQENKKIKYLDIPLYKSKNFGAYSPYMTAGLKYNSMHLTRASCAYSTVTCKCAGCNQLF